MCTSGVKYTLSVNIGGGGEGAVTSDPTGLVCSAGECTKQFDEGTVVELAATATVGSFLGWSNACSGKGACAITMNRDQTVSALFGTPGQALWALQLGSFGGDVGQAVVVDGNNDVIAVGELTNTVMAGTTALASAGGSDIYVIKVASGSGAVLWAKRFGGTMDDVGLDVAVDAANNIYVTGRFLGTVDFGGGALQSGSQADAFVLKLASDGSYGWARKIGGNGFDVGQGIAARGNAVVVVGAFNGSMTVDATTLTSAGGSDIFAMSMGTAAGTTNWVKAFGGPMGDLATDVAIDTSNNVVIVGSYAGTVNFGGGAISTPGGFSDVLLLKLAGATGAHLLSQGYGGPQHDYGHAVALDAANNIFIAGDFAETANFTCAGMLTASQPNLMDGFLAKFSQAGSCLWAKGFGGTGSFDRSVRDLSVNAFGDVAVTGSFCGTMSLGGPTLTAAGACSALDVYAARFAPDGTHLNSVRVGGTGSEYGSGVGQSTDGRFYVTGSFEGLAEFGRTAFTSIGQKDAFLVGLEAL